MLHPAQPALKPRYERPIGGLWSWTIRIKVNLNQIDLLSVIICDINSRDKVASNQNLSVRLQVEPV